MQTLTQWLDRIQQLHPQEIDLGLERVQRVAERLGLQRPAPFVITVTGTNGKGSHVATLDALFRQAGLRVGCYTSPHLLHYNERVCIQNQPVQDQALVDAFERIESVRGDVSLTYFEFGTLAALLIFEQSALDVAVLEVGMGGRLDAVNIVDADIAIVTNIDLDHQDWLGDTRELIALEKAGIFRAGKPVVCAESNLPSTLLDAAEKLGCPLYLPQRDYHWHSSCSDTWDWQGQIVQPDGELKAVNLAELPVPALAVSNVASALQAAFLSGLFDAEFLSENSILNNVVKVLREVQLPGRQQWLQTAPGAARMMVDVAHNPHAAHLLAQRLQRERSRGAGKVHVVIAMMADKDHDGFYHALEKQVDFWYIAHFDLARCLPAATLAQRWQELSADSSESTASIAVFDTVAQACEVAAERAGANDIVVVCGSFMTVADAIAARADA